MNKYTNMKLENTAYYLRETFKFIQQYQVGDKGEVYETLLYIKLNLLENQGSWNNNERVSATNTVLGTISYVGDTYIIVLAKLSDELLYSEYTVNYSTIIEVINESINRNYNLYVSYMSKLPEICDSKEGKYLEIYENLKMAIKEWSGNDKFAMNIIFNGVKSRLIYFSEISFVKNLIILDKLFILPLNYIDGFIITPKEMKAEDSNKGEE